MGIRNADLGGLASLNQFRMLTPKDVVGSGVGGVLDLFQN
jgi:hypothetical protein